MSLIEEEFVSVAKFSDVTGVAKDMVYSYLNGSSTPGGAKLLEIADATGVSLDWLAGRPGAAREYGDRHMLASISAGIAEVSGLLPVPRYDIEARDSGGAELVERSDDEKWLWISRNWADRYGQANLAIIKTVGDSMLPAIEPGNLLLFNKGEKSRGEGVRVVRMNEGLVIKRCEPRPKGGIWMGSDNEIYAPFVAEAGEFEVLGSVLATIKMWE
ncbi:MAG: helix-turn-helix domain-containing protein [Betaproteobacteria bacterium]|nr:helix-turn-helix domain-containing protein [Betaproteobacteria bacterium]